MRKYRILFFIADNAGCCFYRAKTVKEYIDNTPQLAERFEVDLSFLMSRQDWVTVNPNNPKEIIYKNFDLIILQRQYGEENYKNAKFINDVLHIPTVYEIDDFLHGTSPLSSAYFTYNNQQKDRFEVIENFMKAVSAITVTTDCLKEEYSKFNKNIYVIQNSMDIKQWNGVEKKDNGEKIVIGYAGSATHLADLLQCEDAIRQIINQYDNVYLGLGGWNLKNQTGKRMLFGDIHDNRIIEYKWVNNMHDYAEILSNFDIGIAPLEPTRFNECKSSIKYFEMSLSSVPVVASNWGPYELINNGVDGFKCATNGEVFQEWYRNLEKLVLDKNLRNSLNEKAKKRILENHTMQKNVFSWANAWEEIILKKETELVRKGDYIIPTLPQDKWVWRTAEEENKILEELKKNMAEKEKKE